VSQQGESIVVTAATIPGVADGVAACGTERATDESTFKPAMTLRTNDAAEGSTTESANDGSLLSAWSGGAGRECSSGDDGEDEVFHNGVIIVLKQSALSLNRLELFTKKRKFLRIAARSCAYFDSHLAAALVAFWCGFLYLTCILPAVS